jgi:hypothetical protein
MAQATDIMGLGMAPQQASLLGHQVSALTATGSTQATAATMRSSLVEMTATGADGIILPTGASIGKEYYVFNSSASTGLVYVPVGDTLNTTLNGSVSVATHKGVMLVQYKKGFWMSILTA